MRSVARRLVVPVITTTLVVVCLWVVDVERVGRIVVGLDPATLLVAFALLLGNSLLSGIRYHVLLRDFGLRQRLSTSLHNNSVSLLGGLVHTKRVMHTKRVRHDYYMKRRVGL